MEWYSKLTKTGLVVFVKVAGKKLVLIRQSFWHFSRRLRLFFVLLTLHFELRAPASRTKRTKD